jgi:D-glycero-D-manno-heptose 1,7-bisphosphate phosphatase
MNSLAFQFADPPACGRRPAIFLDRDGVINERVVGGYVTSWSGFRFFDGIVPALAGLSQFRLPLIVVSNQAGVGKGLMGRMTLGDITQRFVAQLARARIRIAAVYYCPHTSEAGCRCRKPRPGLLLRAAREWNIDLGRSILVGDSVTDMGAARAAGCRSILFDPQDGFGADRPPKNGPPAAPGIVTVQQISQVPSQAAALLERCFCG